EEVDGSSFADRVSTFPEVLTSAPAMFSTYAVNAGSEGRLANVVAFSGDIHPRAVAGRAPTDDDEVLLSPILAADLDLEIGDRLDIAVRRDGLDSEQQNALTGARPASFEVVGTGPVPAYFGSFRFAMAMSIEGYQSLFPPDHAVVQSPRPDTVLVKWQQGTTDEEIASRFSTEVVTYDPTQLDRAVSLDLIVTIDRTNTESIPDLIGLLMVAISAGVLLYGLAIVLGGSRRDLAVVRALGFDRRMLQQLARWTGLTQVIVVLCLALPLGVLVGRVAWRAYATTIGTATTVRVPLGELALLGVASVALGVIAVSLICRQQTRRRPGWVLRDRG
ncbi:MAG: FtsX-like permease family protein, partial [Acidimicrobiales bacterium]